MSKSRLISCLCFLVLIAASITETAFAQSFPNRSIRIVVPINPGVLPDLIARIVSAGISQGIGQPVVIDNRPGANQMIAYEHVATSAPADGYTMIIVTVSDLALAPVTVKELRFDPFKDLLLVAAIGGGRYALVSPAAAPWANVTEMVATAKASPAKFNYGVVNHFQRFATEALLNQYGVRMTEIPYSGSTFVRALSENEIQLGMLSEGTAASIGPKFRWLAVTGQQRMSTKPDVPTFSELGFPQIRGTNYALAVRTGTPKAAVEGLYSAVLYALRLPEVKNQLGKIGIEVFDDNTADAATRELNQQAKFYADAAGKTQNRAR